MSLLAVLSPARRGAAQAVSRSVVATAVAGAVLAAGAGAAPSSVSPAHLVREHGARPSGSLVLVGGALNEDPAILRRIVALADPDGDGPGRARIAIVTAAAAPAASAEAAADPERNNAAANGLYYSSLFRQYGADTYAVPVDTTEDQFAGDAYGPSAADERAVEREVRRSTGVFFGGGDQMRYVRTLQHCVPAPMEAFERCAPSRVLRAVGDVIGRGGVVSGVSAGTTIQQGPDMVTGGESYEAWRDGATPGYLDDPTALGYLPSGGFGHFRGALLDSHFTTWGRQARMIRLARATGHRRVVGIDETTALVVDRASGRAEVLGEHGVSVLELDHAGTRWSYLRQGDAVDLRTWRVRRAEGAVPVRSEGPGPADAPDAWDSPAAENPGSSTLVRLATDLVRSGAVTASGATYESDPRFVTTLARGGSTRAWERAGVTSFTDLRLTITAVD